MQREPELWAIGGDILAAIDHENIGELEEAKIELHQESSFFRWDTFVYNLIKLV